jgi:hypothetical protein
VASVGAPWPASQRWAPVASDMPSRPLPPPLLVTGPRPVLAQADLEERQQQRPAQAGQQESHREHLAGQSANQHGAHDASYDEQGGGPKRDDA